MKRLFAINLLRKSDDLAKFIFMVFEGNPSVPAAFLL